MRKYFLSFRTRQGSFRRKSLLQSAAEDLPILNASLLDLTCPEALSRSMKGGGAGAAEVESQGTSSAGTGPNGYYQRTPTTTNSGPASPPLMPMNTMPLYSAGGEKILVGGTSTFRRFRAIVSQLKISLF